MNITLNADDDLIAKARAYARARNTTLNQLFRDYLIRVTGQLDPAEAAAGKIEPGKRGAWAPERLRRWQAARDRLAAAERKAKLGVWMFRSTDGALLTVRCERMKSSPFAVLRQARWSL